MLKPGATKVDISGRNGEKEITYRKVIVNGEVVKTEKVDEEITKKARNKVVLKGSSYGTPISKTPSGVDIDLDENNQPINYSRKIYGSCTAYHGDSATSTGRKPGVGVVAVDPREIPYGSVLWIVSKDGSFVYGYAIAGDTGGFIHNSETVVDLYMDSVVEMNTFGRRNLNVYVIKEGKGK
ncbi:MAG: G5 domain-containing protein [Clostridia bacterium]|nr:G5 domain-containing protein [Clostridia bacterium]